MLGASEGSTAVSYLCLAGQSSELVRGLVGQLSARCLSPLCHSAEVTLSSAQLHHVAQAAACFHYGQRWGWWWQFHKMDEQLLGSWSRSRTLQREKTQFQKTRENTGGSQSITPDSGKDQQHRWMYACDSALCAGCTHLLNSSTSFLQHMWLTPAWRGFLAEVNFLIYLGIHW